MPNPFAPPHESATHLWLERSNFVGATLGAVAYGFHLAVFLACGHFLLHKNCHERVRIPLLAFISVMFLSCTLFLASNTKFDEEMWIDDRNIPGGPNAWLTEHFSDAANMMGNAAYGIGAFCADGLLLWRALVVWNWNLWIIALPIAMYVASAVMGIMTIVQESRPDDSFWSKTTISYAIPYFAISTSLNIILTILIVVRLLVASKRIRAALGAEHAKAYTSVAAMLIESAAPYSLTSISFVVCYALKSNIQNLILPVLVQLMAISPDLIILRVALGRAWCNETIGPFNSNPRLCVTSGEAQRRPSIVLSDLTRHKSESTVTGSQLVFKKDSGRMNQGAFCGLAPNHVARRMPSEASLSTEGSSVKVRGHELGV